jgi:serine phosphatase RsbU (regulator of sigma subunit)
MVSQQRSREVAQLEQLGRAIIAAPSDASTLPDLLTEHVPRMFQYRQVEIRVFSGPLLLHQPEHQPELGLETWSWLHDHPIYQIFEAGETLPWSGAALPSKVILAPMLTTDTAAPLGGICLLQDTNYAMDVSVDLQPALQTLAAQVASALHSAAVYRQTLEHQRSAQELAFAGQIQASFLPTSLPRIEGYQLAAALLPARETSGDFFDAIVLPNGRIGLLVADVSDKGMGAALYMALSRTLLRTFAFEYHTRPDFVLRVANRRILADTQAGLFVSVFYAVLDPYEATLSYCNGGHNPAYFFSRQSDLEVRLLRRTGMVLGVLEGMDWQQTILAMGPNDMLVIYSDGITDAQNVAGDFFGEQRLSAVLTENYGRHAQAVVDAVLAEVRAFVGDAPQFDDITLMVLAREATAPSLSQTPQPAIGSAPPIGYNTFGEAPHKTL